MKALLNMKPCATGSSSSEALVANTPTFVASSPRVLEPSSSGRGLFNWFYETSKADKPRQNPASFEGPPKRRSRRRSCFGGPSSSPELPPVPRRASKSALKSLAKELDCQNRSGTFLGCPPRPPRLLMPSSSPQETTDSFVPRRPSSAVLYCPEDDPTRAPFWERDTPRTAQDSRSNSPEISSSSSSDTVPSSQSSSPPSIARRGSQCVRAGLQLKQFEESMKSNRNEFQLHLRSLDPGAPSSEGADAGLITAIEGARLQTGVLERSVLLFGPSIMEPAFWTNVWFRILELRNTGEEMNSLLEQMKTMIDLTKKGECGWAFDLKKRYRQEIMPKAGELARRYRILTESLKQYTENAKDAGKGDLPPWIKQMQPDSW